MEDYEIIAMAAFTSLAASILVAVILVRVENRHRRKIHAKRHGGKG